MFSFSNPRTARRAGVGLVAILAAGGVTGTVLAESPATSSTPATTTVTTATATTVPAPAAAPAPPAPADADHHGHGPGAGNPEVVATALGMSVEDVRTAVEGGKTIAELAAQQGVDVQKVIDAVVAEAKTRIQAKVDSGEITQADADAKLADLTTRVTDMVNNPMPPRPEGMPGGHGNHGAPPAAPAAPGSTANGSSTGS